MAMELENIDSNLSNVMDNEAHIEQLLSEKLMEGFVLLEKSCPVCATPLVKNQASDEEEEPVEKEMEPVMIPSGSFTQPFKPVEGVPFCVSCSSHVITQECEISLLEKSSSLKGKGGILVALSQNETSQPESPTGSVPVEDEPEEHIEHPEDSVVVISENEVDEVHEIIDVTKMEDCLSAHADEKKEDDFADEGIFAEYSVRREIATKVLGAKMLQGYSLMEKQCTKCAMPIMEFQGKVQCVVCPALAKKAKKLMKAQKKVDKETKRLESKIIQAKTEKAMVNDTLVEQKKKEEMLRIEQERLEHERIVREEHEREMERIRLEERERHMRLLQEEEAEQLRRLEMIEKERQRVAALEAESARMLEENKAKAALESKKRADEAAATLDEIRRVKALSIEEEHAAATQKRKEMELKIAEDIKRLEEMETRRKLGLASALESMNRDVLVAEHRKRLEAKATLDLQIRRLERDIINEVQETKTVSDEKRAEVEDLMIALLEEEAAAKAKAAEDAIRKAKAALEHVNSARREIIAQTIALAEQEAVAEAESLIKQEREDYIAPVLLPSASEIKRENWETLRTEGRSVMTRRVMAGWVLLSEFCQGTECHSTPLITKEGKKECVVCGGCGDGKDGAYIEVEEFDVVPTNDELMAMREIGVMPDDEEGTGYEITPSLPRPISPTAARTFQEIQQDFETKRDMVSKEIGRRMIEGWTLLDSSCPNCVMPLMMDTQGTPDICVLCGLVNTIKETDGSTMATADVPTKAIEVSPEVPAASGEVSDLQNLPLASLTQSYNDDAETMFTTLPTMKDSVRSEDHEEKEIPVDTPVEEPVEMEKVIESPPPAPTVPKQEVPVHDDLAESIRQNAQRQLPASATPRSDPPASSRPVTTTKKAIDPVSLSFSLSNTSANANDDEEDRDVKTENEAVIEKAASTQENLSAGVISAMIMASHSEHELELNGTMSKEEVKDVVDEFVTANFDVTVSEEIKEKVIDEVQRKMEVETTTAANDGVIHLEHLPSPQTFKFDMVPSEDHSYGFHDNHSFAMQKRQRPTPESVSSRPRIKVGIPPRPDSTTSRSPRRHPRSTTSSRSPYNGAFIFTNGPSDVTSLGEMSRAESVATDALDSILDRIDAAKSTLLRDDVSVQEQLAAASLIEKLAQAAVAVKKLERMDRF